MSVCLFDCVYLINAKTDDPIEHKFFIATTECGEGDPRLFYFRPACTYPYRLRHTRSLTRQKDCTWKRAFEIEWHLRLFKNLQFQSKSKSAKLKLIKENGRWSAQKVYYTVKKNTNLYTVSSERTWLAKGLGYLWNMALQTYENIKFKLDIYKAP